MSDSTFKIRKATPPPKVKKVGNPEKIDREVRKLKREPGEWFLVREAAPGGAYVVYKKRGCETRTKTVEGGRYDIYARWPKTEEDS